MIHWAIGKWNDDEENPQWELCGIFSNEGDAFGYCVDNPNMFIGPIKDNEFIESSLEWPGSYRPYERIRKDEQAPKSIQGNKGTNIIDGIEKESFV